jgi:hypothetical protein
LSVLATVRLEEWLSTTEPGLSAGFPLFRLLPPGGQRSLRRISAFFSSGCDCAGATAPDFRVLSAFLAVAWPQLFRNHFKSKDFRVVLLKVIPSFRIF